ncbi:GTPase Era [bacterium HR36]|nr:GTPase Era [bacterium HR36]
MTEERWSGFVQEVAEETRRLAELSARWLQRPHRWPYDAQQLRSFQELSQELQRVASRLASEEIFAIVVFMGGTGVGKSTLLNALAGEPISETSSRRPTTNVPVCYIHQAMPRDKLPAPILQNVKTHAHDALRQKVLVDTPDMDTTKEENWRLLEKILEHADIVLYVGSPEKYHDDLGWQLFGKFSKHKAFAFILNRWDECADREKIGKAPDEDWLADLRREGYTNPRTFRTSAKWWLEKPTKELPQGEQFQDFKRWLEAELASKELIAIHQKNLASLLHEVIQCGEKLADSATLSRDNLWRAWDQVIREKIDEYLARCMRFLQERQADLDKFVRAESLQGIPGWWASVSRLVRKPALGQGALSWFRLKRPRPNGRESTSTPDEEANLSSRDLEEKLTRHFGEDYLRYFGEDLRTSLLVASETQGLPAVVAEAALRELADRNWLVFWKEQMRSATQEALANLWQPTGWKGRLRNLLARWLPGRLCWLTGFAGLCVLMYRMFFAATGHSPGLWDVFYILLPFFLAEWLSFRIVWWLSPRNGQAVASLIRERLQERAREHFALLYRRVLDNAVNQVEQEVAELRNIVRAAQDLRKRIQAHSQAVEELTRLYAAR